MIRNIIFDMGKVLIQWDPEYMLSQFPILPNEKKSLQCELFQDIEWVRLDRGTMSENEVIDTVSSRLPVKLRGFVSELVQHWHRDFLLPIDGMADLVRELKANGYKIYLLSNASIALRSYFYRIPGSEVFDGLMVSAEEKLLKPQHEIYERLYDRFALNPQECWFIDDYPPNIEGALVTGMRGSIFRGDVEMLRRELRRAGIHCNSTE